MAVPCRQAEAVLQRDQVPVITAEGCRFDDAIGRCLDRLSLPAGDVETGMKVGFPVERIAPVTEARRNPARNWPDRGRRRDQRLPSLNPRANGLESFLENPQ